MLQNGGRRQISRFFRISCVEQKNKHIATVAFKWSRVNQSQSATNLYSATRFQFGYTQEQMCFFILGFLSLQLHLCRYKASFGIQQKVSFWISRSLVLNPTSLVFNRIQASFESNRPRFQSIKPRSESGKPRSQQNKPRSDCLVVLSRLRLAHELGVWIVREGFVKLRCR